MAMQIHRYVIEDRRPVPPFNEPASQLTIGLNPLKIHHEEMFAALFPEGMVLGNSLRSRDELPQISQVAIVYRDNLWFDAEFIHYFLDRARRLNQACRAAFAADDPAFRTYTLPLTIDERSEDAQHPRTFEKATDADGKPIYLIDLWYFPAGYTPEITPIVIPSEAREKGFYSVPDFMTMEQGDLTHYLPMRGVVAIESWVHVYFASIIFGNFTRASRMDEYIATHNFYSIRLLLRAIFEMKQVLSTSAVVRVGRGTVIHPTAVITGPAQIGENCNIGPGVMLDNCTIGDNVTIDDGCTLMMSTVADGCFLPFRAALYFTSVMENTIIAQNTCLQMCAVGRNSFIGAGSTFTDFNLMAQRPIKAANIKGEVHSVGQIVIGGGVGHNCRLGSGLVVYPGRMIESDVVTVASPERRVVMRSVTYEESDHHPYMVNGLEHKRFYPRNAEDAEVSDESW